MTLHPLLDAADRPVPEISPENEAFFVGCADGYLLLEQCVSCRSRQFYPRGHCIACGGDIERVESDGAGVVHTFTIVRYTRDEPFDRLVPYIVAMIELADGVKIMSNVVTDYPESVSIGTAVELFFAESAPGSGVTLPFWRPRPEIGGAQ